jgi:lysophospholipase L1-like esterase
VTQNPQLPTAAHQRWHEERRSATIRWALDHGHGIVDAYGAFLESGPVDQLVAEDGVHPTETGSQVWRDAILDSYDSVR